MDKVFERVLVPVAVALAAAGSAVALAASSTPQSAPDAIVTYDRPSPTFGRPGRETHYNHGGNTRIDTYNEGNVSGWPVFWQHFTRPGQKVKVSVGRGEDGSLMALSVMDDPWASLPPVSERMMTEVIERHLGEACRVWRAERPDLSQRPFPQSGCTSDDGIELWQRQASTDAIFASSISRRPVAAGEVRIPTRIFDIETWRRPGAPQDHAHDYEAILRGEGRSADVLIQRRSDDWITHIEQRASTATQITTWNSVAGIVIRYNRSSKGERQLSIRREPRERLPMQPPFGVGGETTQMIGGEVCRMWDKMPNVSDGGRGDCITGDGIILASNRMSWGGLLVAYPYSVETSTCVAFRGLAK